MLQKILGPGYSVLNFGVATRAVTSRSALPYKKEISYQLALKSEPDIVVLMLGTNDTQTYNWFFKNNFIKEYSDLVISLKNIANKPKVFLCLPPAVGFLNLLGINEKAIMILYDWIKNVGNKLNCPVINLHDPFLPYINNLKIYQADLIHPNHFGANILAQIVADAIKK